MTEIFAEHPVLSRINEGALVSPRLSVHSEDAMHFLESEREQGAAGFDVIVVDLPDPNNFSLGKLYTHSFYRLLRGRLALGGTAVIQATSPYLAPRSFWCIVETLRAAGLNPRPYHAHVPSFGDWGFVLASHEPRETPLRLANERPLTFLSDELLPTLFTFPLDQRPPPVEVNRLNDQLLVHYYEEDLAAPVWSRGRG
jgi:spermidine synthase